MLLSPTLLGKNWQPNEFDYFGQATHFLVDAQQIDAFASSKPELFRGLFMGFTRLLIELLGLDGAWAIERLLAWSGLALGLWCVMRSWGIASVAGVLAVGGFLLRQTYFGGEWLVGGAESKVFAYMAILLALAAWRSRAWGRVLLCWVIASYLHFLVGGFWALAMLGLVWLDPETRPNTTGLAWRYGLAMVPMLALLLVQEQSMLTRHALDAGSVSVNQIYSNIRNPHHVAPFLHGHFNWPLDGVIWCVLVMGVLNWVRQATPAWRVLATWLMALHAYLLGAFVLAWFDRDTQLLGKFYLFRPASLIWLLSALLLAHQVIDKLMQCGFKRSVRALALVSVLWCVSDGAQGLAHEQLTAGLQSRLTVDESAVVHWVKTSTPANTVILVQEPSPHEHLHAMDFELLTGRPTLVNWKFVPTTGDAVERWYRLNLLKRAAFAGDCDAARQLPVEMVITYTDTAAKAWRACGARPLFWRGGWQAWAWAPQA